MLPLIEEFSERSTLASLSVNRLAQVAASSSNKLMTSPIERIYQSQYKRDIAEVPTSLVTFVILNVLAEQAIK